ncbi:hypothetical protein [Tenacibaculum halocynthiae]|uniref:hypothetical protein n=1 Tax=Tenacibaculum halocynthiae TaxID=1254437 RepID=UPI0038B56E54
MKIQALINSHNELLAIVESYSVVSKSDLERSSFLKTNITKAIAKGVRIKKAVAVTTGS